MITFVPRRFVENGLQVLDALVQVNVWRIPLRSIQNASPAISPRIGGSISAVLKSTQITSTGSARRSLVPPVGQRQYVALDRLISRCSTNRGRGHRGDVKPH